MAQGSRVRPTLRWCRRCSVGWAMSEGFRCWSCNEVTRSERTVAWTSGEGAILSPHQLDVGPDTYAPDMFGQQLAAA